MNNRQPNRLKHYDYSNNGAYFITICTKDKQKIFWQNSNNQNPVGAVIGRPCDKLNNLGLIVKSGIEQIPMHYPNIFVDKYVVMPNHVHILILIDNDEFVEGRPMTAPTVSWVINQFKGYCTKQIGKPIWQKSFYDHIIRDSNDYQRIWQYIDINPIQWELDEYYTE